MGDRRDRRQHGGQRQGQRGHRELHVPPAAKLLHIAGLPAVQSLFARDPRRIERLLFEAGHRQALYDICAALALRHKPFRQASAAELARIAGTPMHGGVVALAAPKPISLLDPAEAAKWAANGEPLLILDGVGNPHNLGAIARTAAFLGHSRLVLSDHPEQALPSDAAYRVAKGGLEHLELYRADRLPARLHRLTDSYRVVGAALSEKGRPPEHFRASARPIALVLGNEEGGLSAATLAACPEIVTIPGSGAMQSLNVAATAAILIHALLAKPPAGPNQGKAKRR
jgi:TrmH RNA methyltransferase